ncbi:hypothetical protein ED312_07945 [Sinomicrobium pectinilyticum]|uniref:Uncharacterized protein n=1 Tax=Sinomicrobium pectinilyticum TaxID=1084421 RepID=A0A3N0ELD9_SINP1|nr:hypothetical protein ED312_07945 [Sinomicrobium pectinilyticum]
MHFFLANLRYPVLNSGKRCTLFPGDDIPPALPVRYQKRNFITKYPEKCPGRLSLNLKLLIINNIKNIINSYQLPKKALIPNVLNIP